MIRQRLSHQLFSIGLILILLGCNSLATQATATPIPPTYTPGPPTSTPESRVKLAMDGDDLVFEDGWFVGATVHTANGDTPPGMASAIYKSTFFDVSELVLCQA